MQLLLNKDERCFNALIEGLEKKQKRNVVEKLQQTLEQIKQTGEESEEEDTVNGTLIEEAMSII